MPQTLTVAQASSACRFIWAAIGKADLNPNEPTGKSKAAQAVLI